MIPATDPGSDSWHHSPLSTLCLAWVLRGAHRGNCHSTTEVLCTLTVMLGWEETDSIFADFKLLPTQHCSPTAFLLGFMIGLLLQSL